MTKLVIGDFIFRYRTVWIQKSHNALRGCTYVAWKANPTSYHTAWEASKSTNVRTQRPPNTRPHPLFAFPSSKSIGKLGPNRQVTTKPYKFFQNIKYQQILKALQTTFSININGGVVVTFRHVQNNFFPLRNMRWILTTIKRKRLGEMSGLRRTIGSWQASKESTRDLQHQTRYVVMYFVIFTSAIQTFW